MSGNLFSQTKVNDVNFVTVLTTANHEVVRLNVAINILLLVDICKNIDHLISQHENSFQREFVFAVRKQILKTRTKQVHYHDIVLRLVHSKPVNFWNSWSTFKMPENISFI